MVSRSLVPLTLLTAFLVSATTFTDDPTSVANKTFDFVRLFLIFNVRLADLA